jgi:hypothetical protein
MLRVKIYEILFLPAVMCLFACTSKSKRLQQNDHLDSIKVEQKARINSDTEISLTNYIFLSDSVFHGYKHVLNFYCSKYSPDSCISVKYNKSDLLKDFEGVLKLGFVHRGIECGVFVLKPLNYCKFANEKEVDGETYYFTDTTLPRLQTDSYCCNPSNIFLVGDIDEDGVTEIGQYYSSCSSRYKSLLVWILKNDQWVQVGTSTFDLKYMDPEKPLSSYVKKTGKNKFAMLERTDLSTDKEKTGIWHWINFSFQ